MADLPYFLDPAPGQGALAPRAALDSDRPELSLDGQWGFRYSPTAAGAASDPCTAEFPDSVSVPGHWMLDAANGPLVLGQTNRFGSPWYTNVQYPFPLDPPFVPDANGTGDYLQIFDLHGGALQDRNGLEAVLLRFEGVESTFKAWLNGTELGHASGSRLSHEFDVTGLLRDNGNRLVVRVHQFSAASYLEDQDQWWLPGIFRSVTLIGQPRHGIRDLRAQAGYHDGGGTLTLTPDAAEGAFPLTVVIKELGFTAQLDSTEPQTFGLGAVDPWSAEIPRLYDAEVRSATEIISLRLGFRTVRIEGAVLQVNGAPIRLKGVNRHEFHPDTGRTLTRDFSRSELISMKRHNINAIRTSHYPPDHHLLDLADELGFWVLDECDLETHGFVVTGWQDNPADSDQWTAACLDRIERTWARDANHASVIMFSLGNESGTGQNLAAMSAWLQEKDPARPVHYEGDRTCGYTDVYSRMYATPEECRSISAGQPIPGMEPQAAERVASKPFLLCEYAHAMGNGPGALSVYEELMDTYPRFLGGFIWEWKDHGLRTVTPDGVPALAYGGDFREPVHDGNFVLDGLAMADGTPSPGLTELAKVFEPVRVSVAADTVSITNRQDFAGTDGFDFRWEVRDAEGKELAAGALDVPDIPARAQLVVPLPVDAADAIGLPPASGAALTVSVRLGGATEWAPDWAPAGHEVAWGQLVVHSTTEDSVTAEVRATTKVSVADVVAGQAAGQAAGQHPLPAQTPSAGLPGLAEFDSSGVLAQLGGIGITGPELSAWRAPTDNDRGTIEPHRELRTALPPGFDWDAYAGSEPGPPIALAERWEHARLDRLSRRTVALKRTGTGTAVEHRYSPPSGSGGFSMLLDWSAVPGGLELDARINSLNAWDFPLARLALAFRLPLEALEEAATVRWLGQGPGETYADSAAAQRWGVHELPASALRTRYPRPQENGRRGGVRWLEAALSDGRRLRVDLLEAPDEAGFSLLPWGAADLAETAHDAELPLPLAWHLVIDAGAHGLGSRSCGIDVLPEHAYNEASARLRLRLAVLGQDTAGGLLP
ncbi:glycoside hydrolase family 2 TIM barrel-domain containing protein [Arthrobacter sp.]|uniref:glycoside hydrolase family 2 TIM barrel-domain containing protein n=1 Tax=Arthrobacter sp. TaxID=1667 RepID=UPI0028A1D073|nr:glycoside hydrolase family 2 TIM barrel-domain containing protein [Arthrobacter sp.]